MYYNFIIYSPVEEHLSDFYSLGIGTRAEMSMTEQVSVK